MKSDKVPVSERALIQRINYMLRKRGEKLINHRPTGDYYTVSKDRVIGLHHDVEKLGRKLGVLKAYESLVS